MAKLPSEWATVDASFGEGRKHLWSPDGESFEFHADYEAAMKAMQKSIEGGAKMVAVLKVDRLFKARPVEVQEIGDSSLSRPHQEKL